METVSVSAHRQVDLVPWPGAAPEAGAPPADDVPPPGTPEATAPADAGPVLEAW